MSFFAFLTKFLLPTFELVLASFVFESVFIFFIFSPKFAAQRNDKNVQVIPYNTAILNVLPCGFSWSSWRKSIGKKWHWRERVQPKNWSHSLKIFLSSFFFCCNCFCSSGFITTQKIKFPIKDFFSKCGKIRRKLQIWLHLLDKSLMENFFFYAVYEALTMLQQGGLSKKDIQLNLCNIFSILISNELYLFV